MSEEQNQNSGILGAQPGVPAMPAVRQPAPEAGPPESAPATMPAPVPEQPKITLDQLVNVAIQQDASDIHFGVGHRIVLRVEGKFVSVENVEALTEEEVEAMVHKMITDEAEQKRLQMVRELDFSYIHSSGVSFRVNVFYSRGELNAVMRMISKHVPSMQELGIPDVMKQFLSLREGLILVTGTTGSGKSTSIQAMLEYVNHNFPYHVITIENPIEHVFKNDKAIFTQRELGKDTLTFANALHSATREDPDMIMMSEINDRATLDEVLNLVEMGHLVISSMATKDVLQTIEHIMAMYPHEEQETLRDRFADSLVVMMSQDLLDRIDQPGRAAVYEILVADKGVKNTIKHGTLTQLRTAMESGAQQGMITMDSYAYGLAENGVISREDSQQYIVEVGD